MLIKKIFNQSKYLLETTPCRHDWTNSAKSPPQFNANLPFGLAQPSDQSLPAKQVHWMIHVEKQPYPRP